MREPARSESNVEIASQWWSDLRDIWTPIGWKNHLFRFNVLWNGAIIAKPDMNRRAQKWKGQGAQITFAPNAPEIADVNMWRTTYLFRDDGMTRQGWLDTNAPVLWTEFWAEGMVIRTEVFGHVPGGKSIESGDEPLFIWARYRIHDLCAALPLEASNAFVVKINAPHFSSTMCTRGHEFELKDSAYPRRLRADRAAYSSGRGLRVLEPGGKVRMAVAPGPKCRGGFEKKLSRFSGIEETYLKLALPAKKGAFVDFLIPMVPMKRDLFDSELRLGYDKALSEANRLWSRTPKTAASVHTPEPLVDRTIRQSLKFSEVNAERNPADGNYTLVSGSYAYTDLWPTPESLELVMLLETFGYHDVAERYLEIFRKEQGSIVPPGDVFKHHPGYLSSPKTLTSIDWLGDHGAILYSVASHALLSGDKRFIIRWMDCIVKACDFIKYARNLKRHGGGEGIMPPAVATDKGTRIQGIWNDGWNYKGLTSAVRVLERARHPRVAEFAREARVYKAAFLKALSKKVCTLPQWTDSRGARHPLVPTSISGDKREETRHAFYLDTGPLFLVFAGLLDANHKFMKSARLWFREGPQTKYFRKDTNCWQVPALDHEMSSCEPCYSWNVFHSHQLADRYRFLEGMYSLFAGSVSRQTYISCETRGGQTGTVFSAPLASYLARLAVIDDQIERGALHLLRLVPLAWLRSDDETVFGKMPTEFGPVTVTFRLSKDARTLKVAFMPRFRISPTRIVLHVPPVKGLKTIVVNGTTFKAASKTIEIQEQP